MILAEILGFPFKIILPILGLILLIPVLPILAIQYYSIPKENRKKMVEQIKEKLQRLEKQKAIKKYKATKEPITSDEKDEFNKKD